MGWWQQRRRSSSSNSKRYPAAAAASAPAGDVFQQPGGRQWQRQRQVQQQQCAAARHYHQQRCWCCWWRQRWWWCVWHRPRRAFCVVQHAISPQSCAHECSSTLWQQQAAGRGSWGQQQHQHTNGETRGNERTGRECGQQSRCGVTRGWCCYKVGIRVCVCLC